MSVPGHQTENLPDGLPMDVTGLDSLGVSPASTPSVLAEPAGASDHQEFRSQVGHISRQSGVFFGGTLFSAAAGYVFKVYLARVLGAEALGLYALGVTLIGVVGMFNTLGLPHTAVRFVAEYQAQKKWPQLHALLWRGGGLLVAANLVFGVLLVVLGRPLTVHFYRTPALLAYLPWFALIMMVGTVSGFYGKVLAGFRDLKWRTLIVNFAGSPLNMAIAVGLIWAGFGLRGYLVAQVLSGAVVCVLLLAAVRRFTPSPARFAALPGSFPAKEVWSFSTAMVGIGLMEFLMTQADKVALGVYRNPREVGVYSVAAAVVAYVPLVLGSVNQIFAPTIAELHARGERALLARLFQSLTKWVTGITLPLVVVIVAFARPMMRIFGPAFESGWLVLIVGTLGQLVNCGVGSVGYLLLMSGHEKRLVRVQMAMTVVMVALCAALVPKWGAVGAAVAAAVTNVGMNLWNLWEVRRTLGLSPYNRSYLRLLLPALAMVVVALLLRAYVFQVLPHDWLAIGVTAVLAYGVFALLVLTTGLNEDDRMIAAAVWSKLRGALGRTAGAEA